MVGGCSVSASCTTSLTIGPDTDIVGPIASSGDVVPDTTDGCSTGRTPPECDGSVNTGPAWIPEEGLSVDGVRKLIVTCDPKGLPVAGSADDMLGIKAGTGGCAWKGLCGVAVITPGVDGVGQRSGGRRGTARTGAGLGVPVMVICELLPGVSTGAGAGDNACEHAGTGTDL